MFDVGLVVQQVCLKVWDEILVVLKKIDLKILLLDNQVNYVIYYDQVFNLVEEMCLCGYEMLFNVDFLFWFNLFFMVWCEMKIVQDYQNYIVWLNDVLCYFGQQIENMCVGLKCGFSVLCVVFDGCEVFIVIVVELKDLIELLLYVLFKKLFSIILVVEQVRLQVQVCVVISGKVVLVFQQLCIFFVNEYVLQVCIILVVEVMFDGKVYYWQQIYEYIMLDLLLDEIYCIGLEEVVCIQKEMNDIIRQVKFKGSFVEFLIFLCIDLQFYVKIL